jgi:hypothetical protein
MTYIDRVPAGTPAGGQFAQQSGPRGSVDLPDGGSAQLVCDEQVRFTTAEMRTITHRMVEMVRLWEAASYDHHLKPHPVHIESLVRGGIHAVGLGVEDATDIEQRWLRRNAARIMERVT